MNILKIVGCCGIGLMMAGTVSAEDVKMYSDRVPSAEELSDILFSNQPQAKPKQRPSVKMRSISFSSNKTPKELPKVEEQIQAQASQPVGLPIKFAYNSFEVLEESKPFLNAIGEMLVLPDNANQSLIIEGHTDAGGSELYNKSLSEKRAQAVKDYLRYNFNVAPNRLQVVGMGESQSLPNVNPYAAVNRRVQFRKAP